MNEKLLEVKNLEVEYQTRDDRIRAVTNGTFSIEKSEYFGLVGESGCGKSTLAKAVIGGLDENGEVTGGKLLYKGEEIQDLSEQELNEQIRWKEISLIPQSAMNSLDPIMRLDQQALELANTHTDWGKEKALQKMRDLFQVVGLPPSRIQDYPHQFSGGMAQRVVIAFSLFLEPSLIIADEPTTALDVIMQDQVFKYLEEIKEENDISMLLITHDISVVFENTDKMAVMHGGQTVETGETLQIAEDPKHPYSILLQRAFPDVRYPNRELETIEGKPPELTGDVDFCTFADRCPWAVEECRKQAPPLETTDDKGSHMDACIRSNEIDELDTTPPSQ